MKVILRESACNDLEGIVRWIADDSPEDARSVARRIVAAIEDKIALFPRMGAPVASVEPENGLYAVCRI